MDREEGTRETGGERIRIECNDCHFSKIVRPEAGESPSEVIVRHGQETGHTLTPVRIE